MTDNPPKPRLALSIGVIGHRPKRLAKGARGEIESEIDRVLDIIAHEVEVVHRRYAAFFSKDPPQLTLVSALAEGADRIAAKTALARGFVLDAPIPFPREMYADDFIAAASEEDDVVKDQETATSSLDEFDALTKAARSFLELPGQRQFPRSSDDPEADKAYEMAGRTVVAQSDVLLTVWDGGPSGGRGGTATMLHEAVRRGIPIIEINISMTGETRICWSNLRDSPLTAEQFGDLPADRFDTVLPRLIEESLRPPSADREREALLSYFGLEQEKSGWFGGLASFMRRRRRLASQAEAQAARYADLMRALSGTHGAARTSLAVAFGWADAMAISFAQSFRRAFIFNFIVAAFAVVAALSSLLTSSIVPVFLEILLIITVLTNTIMGRKLGWHVHWMEAREIAERMRVAILFWILGAPPRQFFGEEPAWTGWYARAAIREQGMRSGRLDRTGMSEARAAMLAVLEHQYSYHRNNARKMKWRERLLERTGIVFFGGTLLVAITHVWGQGLLERLFEHDGHALLIMLSAVLPALATASYGIRLIGDFESIATRSERTEENHRRVIEALLRDPSDLMLFRARARVVADAMQSDVASWRPAAESRGLAIPG